MPRRIYIWPFSNITLCSLGVDGNDHLVGLEVRTLGVVPGGHPHALTLAAHRLRRTEVCEDNVTIEAAAVDPLGRRVEVGATVANTLGLAALTLLPDVNVILCDLGIERHNSELGKGRQLVKLRVECGEHAVVNGPGLVDADGDLRLTVDLAATVDAWVATVETAHSAALVGALASLDEVSKNLLPVNVRPESLANVLTDGRRDGAPGAAAVSFLGSLADGILQALRGDLRGRIASLTPTVVGVELTVPRAARAVSRAITVALATLAGLAILLLLLLLVLVLAQLRNVLLGRKERFTERISSGGKGKIYPRLAGNNYRVDEFFSMSGFSDSKVKTPEES